MKKYILLLGVAGVALGSYAAYAANSATMTVTATIAHDVSLTKTGDLSLGTITINPAYTGDDTHWNYSDSGVISYTNKGAVVSAPNVTVGTFTANIPNPEACSSESWICGGLSLAGTSYDTINNIFGGSDNSNKCYFYIKYTGSDNNFKVYPGGCRISAGKISSVTTGEHSSTLTINYSAGG
ncbi:MAG: hypothetical protein IJ689_03400 [Alphaproteobacteria bacterium]|nr:hypothetical protein [Alphaproteobacteria bacterium]